MNIIVPIFHSFSDHIIMIYLGIFYDLNSAKHLTTNSCHHIDYIKLILTETNILYFILE